MSSNNSQSKLLPEDNEMLDEYDFSNGVRGKYAKKLREAKEVVIRINKQATDQTAETSHCSK